MSLEGRTIAVIEDDPVMGELLAQSLSLEGAKVCLYRSGEAALRGATPRSLDLVVCDIRLPDTDGQNLFHRFGTGADMPPFLFMTAFGDINQAVALMREGAADYLTKPFDMADFLHRVQSSLRPTPQSQDGDMVLGVSPAMRDIEHLLRLVARVESPVLMTGETGTGKEVCARFLHSLTRKDDPFMAVNCAAIPGDLLESELFGHEAGAFTGAGKRHLGFAERAGEGTLFLDEIGELALPLQAKLLRVLEERQFYRLGARRLSSLRPGWSRRPTPTLGRGLRRNNSAPICITGLTSSRSGFRHCGSGHRTFPGCSTASWLICRRTAKTGCAGSRCRRAGCAEPFLAGKRSRTAQSP